MVLEAGAVVDVTSGKRVPEAAPVAGAMFSEQGAMLGERRRPRLDKLWVVGPKGVAAGLSASRLALGAARGGLVVVGVVAPVRQGVVWAQWRWRGSRRSHGCT